MKQLFKVLCDIEDLAGYIPASVSESEEWAAIVRAAEDNRESYYVVLRGKTLYSALYGTYTVTLNEFKSILKASIQAGQSSQGDGFKEVRSQKRHSTAAPARSPKKAAVPTSAGQVPTKNFFAPSGQTTWTPTPLSRCPISAANLIQLQKQLKGVAKQNFEFRSTRNGTRVVTKDMVDYQAVTTFLNNHSLSYYIFYIILYIYIFSSTSWWTSVLTSLASNRCHSLIGPRMVPLTLPYITLPLFLVTLPRTRKSSDLFKFSSLSHISIKVEAYKSQNTFTQCFNCQKFGHVWANCRQPPRCLWCGSGHLHKDRPEKVNES
jgi:hypothetical protein